MMTGLVVETSISTDTNDPQLVQHYTANLRLEFSEVKSHEDIRQIIGIGFKINRPYVQLDLRRNTEELTKDIPLDARVTIPMSSTTKDLVEFATRGDKASTRRMHHETAGRVGYITDEFCCDTGYVRSFIASHANDTSPPDKIDSNRQVPAVPQKHLRHFITVRRW